MKMSEFLCVFNYSKVTLCKFKSIFIVLFRKKTDVFQFLQKRLILFFTCGIHTAGLACFVISGGRRWRRIRLTSEQSI